MPPNFYNFNATLPDHFLITPIKILFPDFIVQRLLFFWDLIDNHDWATNSFIYSLQPTFIFETALITNLIA